MQAAVPREKDDDDVDGSERGDDERRPANAGAPEIENGPVDDGFRVARQLASPEPHTHRDEEQSQQENRREADEDDETCVGIREHPRQQRDQQRDEDHGRGRGHQHADDRNWMRKALLAAS